MNTPNTFAQTSHGTDERPNRAQTVRLNVEQASYAYSASAQSVPTFTLGMTTFQTREREIVAILGPNASGKSTLLRLIAGTIAPLSGRVELDGEETSRLDVRTRAQRIAMVHQESPVVYPALAGDFVLQGRYPYGRALRFANREDIEIARNALSQVGGDHLAKRTISELSGGEKQRVILARALAQQPRLILLDEPTLHLDIGAQVELLERLRQLAQENRYTVVVVTHELGLAAEFADQVVLLQHGRCLRVGSPAAVYQKELLEQVFDAPLDVELGPAGRPRVNLRARRGEDIS
ncbi:MAG TPA: ABC transporter ATP-binding protein [Candidatus Acidoferrales bacterium]|jgi:iron complex transport system ATP-binding protein|nr:ABC transporter ATP-binding protein [Candidatus Acidoferrales bacterium]